MKDSLLPIFLAIAAGIRHPLSFPADARTPRMACLGEVVIFVGNRRVDVTIDTTVE